MIPSLLFWSYLRKMLIYLFHFSGCGYVCLCSESWRLISLDILSFNIFWVSRRPFYLWEYTKCDDRLGQQQSRGLTERRRKDQHQVRRHHRRTSSALTAGLGALADKFHALSSECLRTLRVEMQLQAISHLAVCIFDFLILLWSSHRNLEDLIYWRTELKVVNAILTKSVVMCWKTSAYMIQLLLADLTYGFSLLVVGYWESVRVWPGRGGTRGFYNCFHDSGGWYKRDQNIDIVQNVARRVIFERNLLPFILCVLILVVEYGRIRLIPRGRSSCTWK